MNVAGTEKPPLSFPPMASASGRRIARHSAGRRYASTGGFRVTRHIGRSVAPCATYGGWCLPRNPKGTKGTKRTHGTHGSGMFNAKAQRRKGAPDSESGFLLCVFAPWRLCVEKSFLCVKSVKSVVQILRLRLAALCSLRLNPQSASHMKFSRKEAQKAQNRNCFFVLFEPFRGQSAIRNPQSAIESFRLRRLHQEFHRARLLHDPSQIHGLRAGGDQGERDYAGRTRQVGIE